MDSLSEMEKFFVFNLMVHFRAHEEALETFYLFMGILFHRKIDLIR